eukprot:TRINITY_DN1057_c0_g1_i8.p1 TRINITY_DN1057_c0_g1~~TRINITY_DN1057_c0_g1_i8.p1  ORF type:complete len:313 (-),score=28.48 TRINITY_DN1057_c0_g1_i8:116-985(-)
MTELSIVSGFLKSAPPGEFNEVLQDVKGLLGDKAYILDANVTEEAHRTYNTEQLVAFDAGDHKFLVSHNTQVGPNLYFDSKSLQVHEVDHARQAVISSQPSTSHDSEVEPWRSAMHFELENYVNTYFPQGLVAVTGSKSGSTVTLNIDLSAYLFNTRSFYNGRWRSSWTLTFIPGQSSDLNGKIKCNVHFFEGGNVQLRTDTDRSKKGLSALNPSQLAQATSSAIQALEADWQNHFESLFDNMGQTTFKALRRPLPMDKNVIGNRWSLIQSYKLGGMINTYVPLLTFFS